MLTYIVTLIFKTEYMCKEGDRGGGRLAHKSSSEFFFLEARFRNKLPTFHSLLSRFPPYFCWLRLFVLFRLQIMVQCCIIFSKFLPLPVPSSPACLRPPYPFPSRPPIRLSPSTCTRGSLQVSNSLAFHVQILITGIYRGF